MVDDICDGWFVMAHGFRTSWTMTMLYDNMKQVVLDRNAKVSDSTFNPQFIGFLEFSGIWSRLCHHPCRPQTKSKIENTMKFIRGNFWNGRVFTSLADVNSQGLQWCDRVNARVHRTTGEIP